MGGRWAAVGVNLANPLGGLDQLLHGADHLRGRGTSAPPDPTLYYVRGFDPTSQAFTYEVNPRFGSTRASQNTVRAPFRLTIDVALFLSRPYQLQMLDRSMALVKRLRNYPEGALDTLRVRFKANLPTCTTGCLDARILCCSARSNWTRSTRRQSHIARPLNNLITQLAVFVTTLPPDFDPQAVVKEQNRVLQLAWNAARDQRVPIARTP